jgi:hypothetical protein
MRSDRHAAKQYDVAVAYRIYPNVAKPALGLPLSEGKFRMADACLRSFRKSLGDLRAKVWVLLDGCPDEYKGLFENCFPSEDLVLIPVDRVGNRETFGLQLDILLRQTESELVYFAEDDYFYLPGQFQTLLEFLRQNPDVDFLTPYDHLDLYTRELHSYPAYIRVSGDHHWRTHASTCLTFLTTKRLLRDTERVFRTYCQGNSDVSLWLSLTKTWVFQPLLRRWLAVMIMRAWKYGAKQILFGRRYSLWGPMPSIATHLASDLLAPTINWRKGLQEAASDMSAIPRHGQG